MMQVLRNSSKSTQRHGFGGDVSKPPRLLLPLRQRQAPPGLVLLQVEAVDGQQGALYAARLLDLDVHHRARDHKVALQPGR
jgi:hypothetical protein